MEEKNIDQARNLLHGDLSLDALLQLERLVNGCSDEDEIVLKKYVFEHLIDKVGIDLHFFKDKMKPIKKEATREDLKLGSWWQNRGGWTTVQITTVNDRDVFYQKLERGRIGIDSGQNIDSFLAYHVLVEDPKDENE